MEAFQKKLNKSEAKITTEIDKLEKKIMGQFDKLAKTTKEKLEKQVVILNGTMKGLGVIRETVEKFEEDNKKEKVNTLVEY